MVAQTAVALVLVVSAGLFLHSLRNLWTQDTGYDRRNVLMFSIDARTRRAARIDGMQTYQRVLEELRTQPARGGDGVDRPPGEHDVLLHRSRHAASAIAPSSDAVTIRIAFNQLGPGYFETMGIRSDRRTGLRVARRA